VGWGSGWRGREEEDVGLVVGLEDFGFELVDFERDFVLDCAAGLEDDLFALSLSLGFFGLLVGFSGCV